MANRQISKCLIHHSTRNMVIQQHNETSVLDVALCSLASLCLAAIDVPTLGIDDRLLFKISHTHVTAV